MSTPEERFATSVAWARVANNVVEGLFWLGLFALAMRACGRI